MGVNATGRNGRTPGRHRTEGPEVALSLMESSTPFAALTEDGPAPLPDPSPDLPPEDRLHELPPLTRRAIARLVAAIADQGASDRVWCEAFLSRSAQVPTTPDGAREVLRLSAGVAQTLTAETGQSGTGMGREGSR